MCRQLAALTHIRRMVTEGSMQVGTTKDIREAVEAELAFDPLVDAANITVKNMGGEAALNGTVPSYPQYLQAAAAAQRVAGVRNVHNHLEVVLPPGDYRDDAMLTRSAINALELNVTVPAGVQAIAQDGNITLAGTVSFGSERAAAASAVACLTGVRNIRNQIVISNDADPADVGLSVEEALGRHSLIRDNSDVTVDTDLNTVRLTGHVRTWAEHDAVVSAAWMASGVCHVRDDLSVTG